MTSPERTTPTGSPAPGLSRRSLLARAGIGAAAVAVGGAGAAEAGLLPGAEAAGAAEPLRLARVWFTEDQEQLVATFDDTHDVFADGSVEVLLGPGELARLQESGLRFRITVEDVVARDRALHAADTGRTAGLPLQPGERPDYRQLADHNADMVALAAKYPGLARVFELPHTTLEGRRVLGIEIAEDVDRRDGRPVFYNDGCHHAREWPAAEVPIMWAYDLLEGYEKGDARVTTIVQNVRNIIVPVVNPDGFHYSRTHPMTAVENGTTNAGINSVFGIATKGSYWRKNKRSFLTQNVAAGAGRLEVVNQQKPGDLDAYGVDPNRNYSYAWGDNLVGSSAGPLSDVYRGEKPLSEAEAQNVAHVLKTNQVTAMISHHTSGNLILWAWGDTRTDAPDNAVLAGLGHWCGKYNGYRPQKNIDLYVTTGTCSDYGYGVVSSIGFTFEHAGSTFHPPYASTVPAMYAKNREALMLLAEEMCLLPEQRPVRTDQPAASRKAGFDAGQLNHSLITGRLVDAAGNGVAGTVTLRKRFDTLLWKDGNGGNPAKQKSLEERVETVMVTAADGSFAYHVNPSTRPYLSAAGQTEAYEVTMKALGGGAGAARDLVVERGQVVELGDVRLG